VSTIRWAALIAILVFSFAALTARAQTNLSYEGPTGVFMTPTAYTAASAGTAHGVGLPAVGFHFLAGGPVLGDFSTLSITEGLAKRFEVGITGEFHAGGSEFNPDYDGDFYEIQSNSSTIFTSDFNILHAKAILVDENAGGHKFIPSVAVGGIYRFADHMNTNLCNLLDYYYEECNEYGGSGTYYHWRYGVKAASYDIYLVASKTFTQFIPKVPMVLTAGVRETDSTLWGMAGAAPNVTGRGFGSLAFVIPGPYKSTITPAIEVAKQPRTMMAYGWAEDYAGGWHEFEREGLGDFPTTEAYVLHIAPCPKFKANIDLGVIHLGGNVFNDYENEGDYTSADSSTSAYNLSINARARMFFGLSYKF
jgi:hypothetical protein